MCLYLFTNSNLWACKNEANVQVPKVHFLKWPIEAGSKDEQSAAVQLPLSFKVSSHLKVIYVWDMVAFNARWVLRLFWCMLELF